MPIADLVDALTTYLATAIAPVPTTLGGTVPSDAAQLPALVISVPSAEEGLAGVGRAPRSTVRGALKIRTTIDLANPQLVFPDETVLLLSADRLTLQLAHSPLVRASGSPPPLATGDLVAKLGATTFVLVDRPPAAGEVRVDATTGRASFGAALPATGTLELEYSIGQWDVRTSRYHGALQFDVHATDAAGVDALARKLAQALRAERTRAVAGLAPLSAASWGPIAPPPAGAAGALGVGHRRSITYRFDYEHEEALITTGGGVIVDVTVDVKLDGSTTPETFHVRH